MHFNIDPNTQQVISIDCVQQTKSLTKTASSALRWILCSALNSLNFTTDHASPWGLHSESLVYQISD